MDKKYLEKTCKNCQFFIIRNVQRYEPVVHIIGYCSNMIVSDRLQAACNEICPLWKKSEE